MVLDVGNCYHKNTAPPCFITEDARFRVLSTRRGEACPRCSAIETTNCYPSFLLVICSRIHTAVAEFESLESCSMSLAISSRSVVPGMPWLFR